MLTLLTKAQWRLLLQHWQNTWQNLNKTEKVQSAKIKRWSFACGSFYTCVIKSSTMHSQWPGELPKMPQTYMNMPTNYTRIVLSGKGDCVQGLDAIYSICMQQQTCDNKAAEQKQMIGTANETDILCIGIKCVFQLSLRVFSMHQYTVYRER